VTRKSPSGTPAHDLVFSAHVGTNDELFARILRLYVSPGSTVADVTFGNGIFWKKVPPGTYKLLGTDLRDNVDARALPYAAGTIDCVVLDPPYMHSSGGTAYRDKAHGGFSRYQNNEQARSSDGHPAVVQLYLDIALEAKRVLCKGGILIVKCQDEVAVNRQRLTHVEIIQGLGKDWICEDLFVLVSTKRPGVSRQLQQLHARKAHSYFLIFRKSDGPKVWTGP
jgi:hypothetical protein